MNISQAPLSTPMVDPKSGKLDPNWSKWLLQSSTHQERLTSPKRATALDNPNESLVYIDGNPLIHYTYTGKGGCTFNLNGVKLVLPATAEAQTINSFIIHTGE